MDVADHLQRLERKPGDVFVLSCEQQISDHTAQRLRAELMKMIPEAQVIVLGDGLKLDVVTLPDFEKSVMDVMVKTGVLVRPAGESGGTGWEPADKFGAGHIVEAVVAVAGSPGVKTHTSFTAEALRALADGKRYFWNEDKKELRWRGPIAEVKRG